MKTQKFLLNSILFITLSCCFQFADAQATCLTKQRTLGGSGYDESDNMIKVSDGYVLCGITNSTDGDFNVPPGNGSDAFLVKYSLSGAIIWKHTYGGTAEDEFFSVLETDDGGFIAKGYTYSNDGDISGNHGGQDVLVIKVDASGTIQWQKCYGGSGDDNGSGGAILQNSVGGYIFSAFTNSTDGEVTNNHGDYDAWIVKISSVGKIFSQHTYGGSAYDDASGLALVSGGYIFSGTTLSSDGDVSHNHGGQDSWVVKLDKNGNIQWSESLGGSGDEFQNALARTQDGNIVIANGSNSDDGDVTGNNGLFVAWIVKINSGTGSIIWNKSFTGNPEVTAYGIFATSDEGVVALGTTGTSYVNPTLDAIAIKMDLNGAKQWQTIFGGSDEDDALSGVEIGNGKLIIDCVTASTDGDVENNHGDYDTWLVKFAPCVEMKKSKNDVTLITALNNSPNPFTQSTTISFSLPQSENVSLKIFDVDGRLIRTLAQDAMSGGTYTFTWDARDENGDAVSAGIYLLKIQSQDFSQTEKLMVVK
ncbi:MAG: T9SS type A sorting domain-containing protein [Chitinophagales bacterium]|nr:T9SS type A sorting domain-containing protein [Chitinophagales bacterium]